MCCRKDGYGAKRLNLYLIDMKYIQNLAKADDHVMSVSPQTGKEIRPFVGIMVVCESVGLVPAQSGVHCKKGEQTICVSAV